LNEKRGFDDEIGRKLKREPENKLIQQMIKELVIIHNEEIVLNQR
jgi:hypothetical protein